VCVKQDDDSMIFHLTIPSIQCWTIKSSPVSSRDGDFLSSSNIHDPCE